LTVECVLAIASTWGWWSATGRGRVLHGIVSTEHIALLLLLVHDGADHVKFWFGKCAFSRQLHGGRKERMAARSEKVSLKYGWFRWLLKAKGSGTKDVECLPFVLTRTGEKEGRGWKAFFSPFGCRATECLLRRSRVMMMHSHQIVKAERIRCCYGHSITTERLRVVVELKSVWFGERRNYLYGGGDRKISSWRRTTLVSRPNLRKDAKLKKKTLPLDPSQVVTALLQLKEQLWWRWIIAI